MSIPIQDTYNEREIRQMACAFLALKGAMDVDVPKMAYYLGMTPGSTQKVIGPLRKKILANKDNNGASTAGKTATANGGGGTKTGRPRGSVGKAKTKSSNKTVQHSSPESGLSPGQEKPAKRKRKDTSPPATDNDFDYVSDNELNSSSASGNGASKLKTQPASKKIKTEDRYDSGDGGDGIVVDFEDEV